MALPKVDDLKRRKIKKEKIKRERRATEKRKVEKIVLLIVLFPFILYLVLSLSEHIAHLFISS